MDHKLSSTDLQDLETRKEGMLSGENNDIRGMKMEKFRQVKRIARPQPESVRAWFIYSLNI